MQAQQARVLVTGAAGFIGFHLCIRLLKDGQSVLGIDNLSDYYDVNLKHARLDILRKHERFSFLKADMADQEGMEGVFEAGPLDVVVNLAAQVGVRYSLVNPHAYGRSNLAGFLNLMEGCRHKGIKHLVFASSSSVYGANTTMPFSTRHNVDHPVSLYAATKKANELMAHAYSHLYRLPCTGLRFFTVYGPWGRPDMAPMLFTRAILAGEPIQVFNNGNMQRDFTYIDDIIEGVVRVMRKIPEPDPDWNGASPDPSTSSAPYAIYNIGNNRPVRLLHFIDGLEKALGKTAKKEFLDMQPGDVPSTFADIDDLEQAVGFRPTTPIEKGIQAFVEWYRDYYGKGAGLVVDKAE